MAKKEDNEKNGALFIPAGVIMGMGFGWLTDNFLPGMFIGLGTGFVIFALITVLKK